ncbi:MAG: acyltransferase [Alphaproteobacteria bacterium]|nr:acyltransferase [Alphaproteobacteria bacterium]
MALEKRALLPALDGLRAMAAMIVLLSHYSNETAFLRFYAGIGAGQLGVILFFALSGFLMCYVTEGVEPSWKNILNFWQRRLARVLPLFIFVVLASYFLGKQTLAGESLKVLDVNDGNLLRHLFLMDGVSVLWTIPVEICFYVVYPAIWYLRARLKNDTLMVIGLLVAFLVWNAVREPVWAMLGVNLKFLEIVLNGHIFLLGILAYLAFRLVRPMKLNYLWLALMAMLPLVFPHFAEEVYGRAVDPWADPVIFLLTPMLLFATVRSNWAEYVLGNPVLRYLGNISYSIYLTHWFVLRYMQRFYELTKSPVNLAILLVLVVALASVTYFLIEKPSRKYLNQAWGRVFDRKPPKDKIAVR